MKEKLIDRFLYRAVVALFSFLGRLPRSMRDRLASSLGGLIFKLDRKHRRIAIQNLNLAFGEEKTPAEIFRIARQVFENLIRVVFEVGWSLSLPWDQFSKYIRVIGLEEYRQALAKGRGVLFLLAHFGNWELLPIIGLLGQIPVRTVYRKLDAPFLERFFKENRCRYGGQVIATHRGAARDIYRELRKGFPVAMLMDQNVDWYDGVFVDFFGQRACTNKGMALLAIKSQAPVVPVFLIRRPDGFDAVFGPELPVIQTGDRTKDIEENSQLYNLVIETYARRYPEQWFWVHQRWKTKPYQPWPRA
ncbi:MAG: lysophospholipid acyltransferase family protein [Desulfobacteraceae bacterium]|nr:lysophospholipid acyltransferase family protein [Desulfobacteraceae bacterium]